MDPCFPWLFFCVGTGITTSLGTIADELRKLRRALAQRAPAPVPMDAVTVVTADTDAKTHMV